MAFGDKVNYRDTRTGRFRKARNWEKNRYYQVDTLSKGLAQFCFKSADRAGEIAQEFAEELVDYARTNAPWTDRTGDARAGLVAEVLNENNNLQVTLQHTVSYGIWLEIRWGARYAIIIPTMETMGPKLFRKMNDMFSEIIYYD